MEMHPLFLYGTLKRRAFRSNHNHHLVQDHIHVLVPAELAGCALRFAPGNVFPYICQQDDSTVHGELVWINPDSYDNVIRRLDYLEGVPHHYTRVLTEVMHDHRPYTAWMYVPVHDVSHLPIVELGEW